MNPNGRAPIHGHASGGRISPTYESWHAMIGRCSYPSTNSFEIYGGRGIYVCERWKVFINFLSDMGTRPTGYTLERIRNEDGYEPGNCRWATPKEQANNRSSNVFVLCYGERLTIAEAAKRIGVWPDTLGKRIQIMENRNIDVSLIKWRKIRSRRGAPAS